MEENQEKDLISKQELLSMYGISYGALYRYKRMGLIPESWFIRVSTKTGQETFFLRKPICERMNLIIAAKDASSLQELARRLQAPAGKDPELVVETSYGKKVFKSSTLKKVYLHLSGKEDIDLSEEMMERMGSLLSSSDTKDDD